MKPHTLISTVGTSLFSNLGQIKERETEELAQAYREKNWLRVSACLGRLQPGERLCGAEINSIQDLLDRAEIQRPPFALHFCVSDTEDGRAVGTILKSYYESQESQQRFTL